MDASIIINLNHQHHHHPRAIDASIVIKISIINIISSDRLSININLNHHHPRAIDLSKLSISNQLNHHHRHHDSYHRIITTMVIMINVTPLLLHRNHVNIDRRHRDPPSCNQPSLLIHVITTISSRPVSSIPSTIIMLQYHKEDNTSISSYDCANKRRAMHL